MYNVDWDDVSEPSKAHARYPILNEINHKAFSFQHKPFYAKVESWFFCRSVCECACCFHLSPPTEWARARVIMIGRSMMANVDILYLSLTLRPHQLLPHRVISHRFYPRRCRWTKLCIPSGFVAISSPNDDRYDDRYDELVFLFSIHLLVVLWFFRVLPFNLAVDV